MRLSSTMFPELEESDGEELPTFQFLSQQPPELKATPQPPLADDVVVLCSSDSEDSSVPSPAWKKSRSAHVLARAAARSDDMAQPSSESEEDEVIVPLAERLKRRFLAAQPSTVAASFTTIQERSNQDSVSSGDEKVAAGCWQQSLARGPDAERRAVPRTWELSESDSELPPFDLEKQLLLQPPECVSDCPAQNSSRRGPEISLKPFPLQTSSNRSQEEIAQARQAALQRREARGARQVLLEQERERKKALAGLRKAQRPEQCLKHVQVVLDPGLLQVEGGGQVLTTLQSMECSCVIEGQAVPRSITWRRKSGLAQVEGDNFTEEPHILVLMLPEEFVAMVHNYKQISMEGPTETLQRVVANIMEKTPGKTLALAVVELEKYFSSHKQKSQKKWQPAVQNGCKVQEQGKQRHRRGKANSGPELSRVDVEEALVSLQIHTGVQVRVLESWKELGDFASMFTKAVAEAPFKYYLGSGSMRGFLPGLNFSCKHLLRPPVPCPASSSPAFVAICNLLPFHSTSRRERDKTSFSFCLEGDWSGGAKVERSGKGLLQVWKRQIQQFNRVSLEMANAVVARYPSPLLLMQAYDTHSSEQERHNLLAEIPVRRGDGVTATTRRVGPDLSKRIYLQMTSYNPDLSLDVTG